MKKDDRKRKLRLARRNAKKLLDTLQDLDAQIHRWYLLHPFKRPKWLVPREKNTINVIKLQDDCIMAIDQIDWQLGDSEEES